MQEETNQFSFHNIFVQGIKALDTFKKTGRREGFTSFLDQYDTFLRESIAETCKELTKELAKEINKGSK